MLSITIFWLPIGQEARAQPGYLEGKALSSPFFVHRLLTTVLRILFTTTWLDFTDESLAWILQVSKVTGACLCKES